MRAKVSKIEVENEIEIVLNRTEFIGSLLETWYQFSTSEQIIAFILDTKFMMYILFFCFFFILSVDEVNIDIPSLSMFFCAFYSMWGTTSHSSPEHKQTHTFFFFIFFFSLFIDHITRPVVLHFMNTNKKKTKRIANEWNENVCIGLSHRKSEYQTLTLSSLSSSPFIEIETHVCLLTICTSKHRYTPPKKKTIYYIRNSTLKTFDIGLFMAANVHKWKFKKIF